MKKEKQIIFLSIIILSFGIYSRSVLALPIEVKSKGTNKLKQAKKDDKKIINHLKDKSKKIQLSLKNVKEKISKEVTKDINKLKNPNYPQKESDILIEKGSKVNKFSKKIESVKKDIYEYIDDDIRPLTILFMPALNFMWNSKGEVKQYHSCGWQSITLFRFSIMYDIQIGESNFFFSPGIGWSNSDYVFTKKCFSDSDDNEKLSLREIKQVVNKKSIDDIESMYLSTCYFDLISEFQFRSNKIYYKEGLFCAIGVKFGFMLLNPTNNISYLKTDKQGLRQKRKFSEETFGISNWKFSVIFRAGLGSFGGYVELMLTDLLDQGLLLNPKNSLHPIAIGLSVDFV